ncbi:MAG: hypothetical protein NUV73_04365 [Candidatus Daviesbacteria bacterium]|nr:hypothetical protein [Candidatus Daviesbacteria bacterium]
MVDTMPGLEESRALQEVARKEQIKECIESGQIAIILSSIYTMNGRKNFGEDDFGRISNAVLGSFQDDKRGSEAEGRVYLIVDCRGKEGVENALPVRNKMADLLYQKLGSRDEKPWNGTWIPYFIPSPIPESAGEEEIKKLKGRISYKILQLLKTDPGRVKPVIPECI